MFSVILKFCLHALTGTLIFGTVAGPAVLLQLFMRTIEDNCSTSVIMVLRIAEYGLLLVDLALFLVFLVATARNTGAELWVAREDGDTKPKELRLTLHPKPKNGKTIK